MIKQPSALRTRLGFAYVITASPNLRLEPTPRPEADGFTNPQSQVGIDTGRSPSEVDLANAVDTISMIFRIFPVRPVRRGDEMLSFQSQLKTGTPLHLPPETDGQIEPKK
jgi:hypothetical protein